jgi:hypothetical protein
MIRQERLRAAIAVATAIAYLTMSTGEVMAQRMGHGGGGGARGGGGGRSASAGHSASRPSSSSQNRQAQGSDRATINGGNQRGDRSAKPGGGGSGTRDVSGNKPGNNNSGNRNNVNNGGGRNNINGGNTNVNININNSHNTTVRRNTNMHYNSPPYRYGERGYYCAHPYYYHPYHPYAYGPAWHPWGFVVATLAVTAIVVSVNSQQYHYDNGVYYVQSGSGYTVVQAPVGATVTTIPAESQTVVVNQTTNNYYYGGTYYEKSAGGYTVVPPTAGTVVESLPEGAEEVKIGDQTYVKYGETYYQPIQKDGKNMYEVVQVEEEGDAKK